MEKYIQGDQVKIYFGDGSTVTAQVMSDDGNNLECSALSKNEVYKEGDTIFADKNNSKIEKLNLKKKSIVAGDWNYFLLSDRGEILDENGDKIFNNAPKFNSVEEADQWLVDNDERGNVIGTYEDFLRDESNSKIDDANTLYSIKKKANSVNEIKSLIEGKKWKEIGWSYWNNDDESKSVLKQLGSDSFSLIYSDSGATLYVDNNKYNFPDITEKEYDSIMKPHLNDNEDEQDFESYSMRKKAKTFNWEFDKHKPQWKLNKESMEIERDDDAVVKIAKLRKKLAGGNYRKINFDYVGKNGKSCYLFSSNSYRTIKEGLQNIRNIAIEYPMSWKPNVDKVKRECGEDLDINRIKGYYV